MAQHTENYPELERWEEYYQHFSAGGQEDVREGCHALIKEHAGGVERSIVLTHGLTDSPHFMDAIGRYFHFKLGYNVYLPLLQCHGLKNPQGMRGVDLKMWRKNLTFAIDLALKNSGQVSLGGLSTGAALSLYHALTDTRVSGHLYLFSGALVIGSQLTEFLGPLRDLFLESSFAAYLDDRCNHIGENPYRYDRINFRGVLQLRILQVQIMALLSEYGRQTPYPGKVFVAHSHCDNIAGFYGISRLKNRCESENLSLFWLEKELKVHHASVVLKEDICGAQGNVLEKANPLFQEMMEAVARFQQ